MNSNSPAVAHRPRLEIVAPGTVRKDKFPLAVRRGSVVLKIYAARGVGGRAVGPYTVAWHEPEQAGRCRAVRADLADAKNFADEKATELANGETWRAQFGPAEFYAHQNREAKAAALRLSQDEIFQRGLDAIKAEQSRAKIVSKTCPQLVADLISTKKRERSAGSRWIAELENMLNRFAGFWSGPLHLLQPPELNQFLRGLKGGLVYRRHHRAAVLQLIRHGKAISAVPRDAFNEDFWKLVDDPEPPKVRIIVWQPEQCVKLLAHTRDNMIPFTVLQAFAGIRHEELNPKQFAIMDKIPLDWRDIDWDQKLIEVKEETGKTGTRLVPMSENLIAWLLPYRKERGPVCTVKNTANKLNTAKKRARLPSGRNESRNVLRKSFGSYRLAVVKNIGQVAEEMGNSPAKLKSNYRKPRPESEGKSWFKIWPTQAEILQLPLAGIK